MKRTVILIFSLLAGASAWACTNLLVGKGASVDGSTMVTYSADSYTLFGELYHWPAATYQKGEKLKVYEWDTGKFLGEIDQVGQTYNVIGNMNEHQLCIAETTFSGRPELQDTTGIMDYGSLIYITLQRAKTAREAIQVITQLVEKYGYYSGGESFSIVDKNEVWIMELIGKGVGNTGAVWVAVRIPDDCISAHANQSRIHQFPLNDKENCLYSKDVISFARQKGYFTGKDKDFSFTKAYAPLDFGAMRYCEARVWSFFNRYYSGADKWVKYAMGENNEPMPLYIKPDRKLSNKDLMNMMRDHYEGTPMDPTQDIGAGPFQSPFRFSPLEWKLDSADYCFERPIATQQTGFTFVGQMRNYLPDEVGGVLWFGVDDATFTVYTPMYSSMTRTPECFRVGNGDFNNFSWTSSFWIHNWVANMAYARYNQMVTDIKPVQDRLELGFIAMMDPIDKKASDLLKGSRAEALEFLTEYSCSQAQKAFDSWKTLGTKLLVKYMDGAVKKTDKDGNFLYNEYGQPEYPNRPKLSEETLRKIVTETGDKLKIKPVEN